MLYKFQNHFYLIILIFSLFTILSALYIEHILLIPACKLCLYQRIPYILSIILCFFGYFFSKSKIWLYLLIVTFSGSIIISGYHLGIENGVFVEFSGCTNENVNTINKSELLESLKMYYQIVKMLIFEFLDFRLRLLIL